MRDRDYGAARAPFGCARRRLALGHRIPGRGRARTPTVPSGETHGDGAAQPVRVSRTADRGGTLARGTRGQRDDRHLRRPGRRRAASRGRFRGRHRNQPRADPVLGGRRGDGGGREWRGIRAAVHDAADLRRCECVGVSRADRPAVEPHRYLPARRRGAARRCAPARSQPAGPASRGIRSLRVSVRTLWYYIVLAVSTVYHAVGAIIAGLFRVKNRRGGIYDWANIDWARDILRAAGTPVAAEGLEHIPPGQPLMYASNHSSMFDIWALLATLPGSVRFVAKQEPFKNAPFGLAIAAQVPIVPVYAHHTFEILPKGSWRLRPRPIRLLVGTPISTAGLQPEDRERLRDQVRAAMVALQLKAR